MLWREIYGVVAFSNPQAEAAKPQETCGSRRCLAVRNVRLGNRLERAKGFEPSTPTLARLCSTPELRPHPFKKSIFTKVRRDCKPLGIAASRFPKPCYGPHRVPDRDLQSQWRGPATLLHPRADAPGQRLAEQLDLPRFCGEALGQVASIFSNCTGLVKSSAEWRRMGL